MKQHTSSPLKPKLAAWPHRKQAFAIVLMVAVGGALYVLFSLAASAPVAKEAESGSRSGTAIQISDGGASSGYAVRFGSSTGGDLIGAEGMLAGNQGYCAQPNAGLTASGTRLVTQACNESPPQIVNFIKNGSKEGGMVRFKYSYLCMRESGTTDLSQVALGACDNAVDAARWIPTADHALKNAQSGLCLRPKGGAIGVGLYLEVTNCSPVSSSPNQLWNLPVDYSGGDPDTVGPEGMLAGNQGYCAQPNAGVGGIGVRLVTQLCNESPPQIVNFIYSGTNEGGMVRFKSTYLCMAEAGTSDGAQVQMADCDNSKDSMRWVPTSDGALQNAESDKCLRPKGGVIGVAYLEITTCNNTSDSPNQRWYLPVAH